MIFWHSLETFSKFYSTNIPNFLQILTESKFEDKLKDHILLIFHLNSCYIGNYDLISNLKFKCVIFDPVCIIIFKHNCIIS